MVRRWLCGLVAVGVLIAAGLTTAAAAEPLSAAAGQDVPIGYAGAAPTTGTEGSRTLAASENAFPDTGGAVVLTGTGFDPKVDVYLAVCAADIKPTDDLTYCIGGVVPDGNETKAWAVVTGDTAGKTNAVAFTPDGSFSATLTLDTPTGSSVDCVTSACAVIARSTGEESTRPADMLIPVTFETSGPTTTDNGGEVGPDAVSLPQANIGDQQTIVFSGFTPDEPVTVTLFSDPINLPGVNATASGVVTVSFRVSDAMVPGQHVLQAVGSQSNRFGIAYFEVLAAAPVTTSSAPATTSSAPTTTSSPATTTSATPTSTTTETATATTSSAPVVPVTPTDSGRNLWWLWIALIAVVIVGAVTGVVIMSRRRKEQLAAEERQREQELQDAAAEPSWRAAGTEPYPPTEPYDDGGLLSGRAGPGPDLYGGGQPQPYPPAAPTTRIPPPNTADLPTQAIPSQAPTPPAGTPPPEGPVTDTEFWLRELGTDPDQDDPPRR